MIGPEFSLLSLRLSFGRINNRITERIRSSTQSPARCAGFLLTTGADQKSQKDWVEKDGRRQGPRCWTFGGEWQSRISVNNYTRRKKIREEEEEEEKKEWKKQSDVIMTDESLIATTQLYGRRYPLLAWQWTKSKREKKKKTLDRKK
jgi:hypothetical protein